MTHRIIGMTIVNNGSIVATVQRDVPNRFQWTLSGRIETPDATSPTGKRVSLPSVFRRTINECYAEIRKLFPGSTITYIKSGKRRRAA